MLVNICYCYKDYWILLSNSGWQWSIYFRDQFAFYPWTIFARTQPTRVNVIQWFLSIQLVFRFKVTAFCQPIRNAHSPDPHQSIRRLKADQIRYVVAASDCHCSSTFSLFKRNTYAITRSPHMSIESTKNPYGNVFLKVTKCVNDCARILKRGYLHRLQCKVSYFARYLHFLLIQFTTCMLGNGHLLFFLYLLIISTAQYWFLPLTNQRSICVCESAHVILSIRTLDGER